VTAAGRVLGAADFWVAVVAAAASIAAAVIAANGRESASPPTASAIVSAPPATGSARGRARSAAPLSSSPACLRLIERTWDWAARHPRDAALYAAAGDAAARGLPELWSTEERDACGGDPERLLEARARQVGRR
jgi:hypothetical protein